VVRYLISPFSEYSVLGDSFFGNVKGTLMDHSKIRNQRIQYLKNVSESINERAGVNIAQHSYNNIAYEYLSSRFMGTSFGSASNNSSDLAGVLWDYGGADILEKRLPKNPFTLVGRYGFDIYFSSQSIGIGSDKGYMDRVRALHEFKTNTIQYLDVKTLMEIGFHKY